jgi:hypothetical protein
MSVTVSPSSWLCGNSAGNLYLVDSSGQRAIALSVADFDTFRSAGWPVIEVSDSYIACLKNVGGTGLLPS